MKKIRHFFIVVTILFCSLLFSGCEQLATEQLFGTWYSEYVEYVNGTEILYSKTLTFSRDNKYTLTVDKYVGFSHYNELEFGTYYCDGWGGLEMTYVHLTTYEECTFEYTYDIYRDMLDLVYYDRSTNKYYTETYYR